MPQVRLSAFAVVALVVAALPLSAQEEALPTLEFSLSNPGARSLGFWRRLRGQNWLFVESGESLIMLVDGERHVFSGDGSWGSRNVRGGSGVYIDERARYRIMPEGLRRIAGAKEVRFRLYGSEGFVQRSLSGDQIAKIGEWVAEYVD